MHKLVGRILATIILGISLGFPLSKLVRPVNPLESVAYVTNKAQTSGGTGFHILAPSGTIYLITNAHVCEGVESDGEVYVRLATEANPVPRRVIQESPTTDLCIVEALPQAKPVKLAPEDPVSGQELHAIGHPRLMQITRTDGRTIGPRRVEMIDKLNPAPGECTDPKNIIKDINLLFWTIPACMVRIDAIITTVTILPGSSGSPIFDSNNRVRGVAFGSDDSMWAAMVPVSDLHKFIEHY